MKERIRYTYEDYLSFPDGIRCEIIDGKIHDMTPSPTCKHQRVSGEIYWVTSRHLKERAHPCQVFHAPLDVILAEDQVVQPDVFIVCDPEKVRQYIFGAPDVIFEVVSPSTTLKDRREKMDLYERVGVKEYFLVDLEGEFIEKYMLHGGKYNGRAGIYAGRDAFRIEAVELEIVTEQLFVF